MAEPIMNESPYYNVVAWIKNPHAHEEPRFDFLEQGPAWDDPELAQDFANQLAEAHPTVTFEVVRLTAEGCESIAQG